MNVAFLQPGAWAGGSAVPARRDAGWRYGRGVRRLLTAGVAVAAVLAGCASPPPVPPAPAVDGPAATVELPPRPRDVPVDGIDPCTLLTEADRA